MVVVRDIDPRSFGGLEPRQGTNRELLAPFMGYERPYKELSGPIRPCSAQAAVGQEHRLRDPSASGSHQRPYC